MSSVTKEWIAEKMKLLIRKKSLEKIRIREICEAAGVDRSTFYYHFRDKYDLVIWMYFREINELNILVKKESVRGLQKLKQDAFIFRNALAAREQNSLYAYMKEYYIAYYLELLKKRTGADLLGPELTFYVRLFCYGAVDMMVEWILDPDALTAEEYVEMVYRSMPAAMYRICFPDEQ